MPESIIKRIEAIAEKEKEDKNLVFSDRNEEPLYDDAINDAITAGVDNDNEDDDTGNTNNPPDIMLSNLVGNNDDASKEETTDNESTGVPAGST
jgi:hypothetical protein